MQKTNEQLAKRLKSEETAHLSLKACQTLITDPEDEIVRSKSNFNILPRRI